MLLACQGSGLRANKVRGVFRMARNEIGFVDTLAVAMTKVLSRHVCCVGTRRDKFLGGGGRRCLLRRNSCAGEGLAEQCDMFFHHTYS